jgi:hypothetical protein
MNIFSGKTVVKATKQSDYPALPYLDNQSIYSFSSLEELTQNTDLIIVGTVDNILPSVTNVYIPEKGTPEYEIGMKNGQTKYEVTWIPVKIKINDILKGKTIENEVVLYRYAGNLYAEPQLSPGDKLIFFLEKDDDIKGYSIISPHEGFFYVASDDKVYPAEVTEGLKNMSGMSLGKFKKYVRSYVK